MERNVRSSLAGLFFGFFLVLPAEAATYYVTASGSGSSCTQGSPCRQIYTAVALDLVPGDIIEVDDGTYEGGWQWPNTKNGTFAQPITIRSKNRYGAIISDLKSGGSTTYAVDVRADYAIIEGLKVDGTSQAWRIGIYLASTGGIAVNNWVTDIGYATACPGSAGGAGIILEGFYGDTDELALNNLIVRTGPSAQTCHTVHSIYVECVRCAAIGNAMNFATGWCIEGYHVVSDDLYANNTCYNTRYGGYDVGTVAGNTNDRSTMINNIVVGAGACSYGFNRYSSEGTVSNLAVINNTAYNCTTAFGNITGAVGSLTTDPLLVDPTGGDFRLQRTPSVSPAIDAGAPVKGQWFIDNDGFDRRYGVGPDRGAFENRSLP